MAAGNSPLGDDLLTTARVLRDQGMSARAVARQLGCSHTILLRHLGPWPKKPPQYSDELVRQVRDRYAAGETLMQLHRAIGIPHGVIADWCWGRTRRAASGMHENRGRGCAGRCGHWSDQHGCGLQFPPEDWSPTYCGSIIPPAASSGSA